MAGAYECTRVKDGIYKTNNEIKILAARGKLKNATLNEPCFSYARSAAALTPGKLTRLSSTPSFDTCSINPR